VTDSAALRARRYRAHRDGDHSLCRHGAAPAKGDPARLVAATLEEFPAHDAMSRELALRLADLASGHGAAAVGALRALAELVAAQRTRL
jgi:hypothetical protein